MTGISFIWIAPDVLRMRCYGCDAEVDVVGDEPGHPQDEVAAFSAAHQHESLPVAPVALAPVPGEVTVEERLAWLRIVVTEQGHGLLAAQGRRAAAQERAGRAVRRAQLLRERPDKA